MTTMTTIDKLEAVVAQARKTYREVIIRKEDRYSELYEETKELNKKHLDILDAEFGEKLEAAEQAVFAAQKALDDANIAEHSKAGYMGLPVGTRLVQWKKTGPPWYGPNWLQTGTVGVLEVFEHGSAKPRSKASAPSIGSFIVRHLKKDGSPSRKFNKAKGPPINGFYDGPWLPEGVTIEQALKAKEVA